MTSRESSHGHGRRATRRRAWVLRDLEIHALNLRSALSAERPGLARRRRFLSYESDEAPRLPAMSGPKMALAVERLGELSQDPEWLSRAEERRIGMQLHAMEQEEFRKLGREEGLAEGERKGLAELVRLARAVGLDERDVARLGAMPLADASAELARLLARR